MNARARSLLTYSTMAVAACALGGCEWIAGIEDTTVGADAGQPAEDASPSGPGDGGDGTPDAAVSPGCPAPCVADAVAEFDHVQGGLSSQWLYAEDRPGPFGVNVSEMLIADRGGTQAWVGTGGLPPAIVHCPSSPGYRNCEGVEDKLLLETAGPGANHPALLWIVPQGPTRRYRLSGDWQLMPRVSPDTPITVLLVRNSRFDSVVEERILTGGLPAAFDVEVDVLPGDALRLIAIPDDYSGVSLAVSFYASGAQTPGCCQMTTHFEDDAGAAPILFPNLCGSSPFRDRSDTDSSCAEPDPLCPATTNIPSPQGIPSQARAFVEGASVQYLGTPNDYSGDWTVQLWAYLDLTGSSTTETLLADHDCVTEGGISVRRFAVDEQSSEMTFEAYFDDPAFDRCVIGPLSITTSVTSDEWHFVRFTRSTAAGTMSACIDGVHVGDVPVAGDADMSATESMWLGRAVTYEPAHFRGRLADLRVFSAALPCSAP